MYKVNIPVTGPDMTWIVGRLAKELVDRLPAYGFDAQINRRGACDIEYHANVYGPPSGLATVNIGMFAQEDQHAKWVPNYDGHVVLNPAMQELVYTMLLGKRPLETINPVVIEQAVDAPFVRKTKEGTVFGVAGSVKKDGRKGEVLVRKMVDEGYYVLGWGKGWPCKILSANYADLPDFYQAIDYLVVTSTMEGGCTPIIEAMAMGVPVISPKLGFAIRRPVLEYDKGGWESLHAVLKLLTTHRTYDDWAKDHAEYFRRFL